MVRELDEYAKCFLRDMKPGEVVPVSRNRSQAQARNPHADDNDVGLIVAYRDGRCVGYLGLLAGLLRVDGEVSKICRLSTWYVAPEERASGVGGMLMLRALALRKDLMVTGVSEEAAPVYEALRFKPLGPLRYLKADLKRVNPVRLCASAIRKAVRRLGLERTPRFDQWVRRADGLGRSVIYRLPTIDRGEVRDRFRARRVERLTDRSFELAQDATRPVRFFRDAAEINWMLEKRWVTPDVRRATPGYYFADYDPMVDFVTLEIEDRKGGKPRGFIVLRIDGKMGRRNMMVLDYHFWDVDGHECLLPVVLEQARTFQVDVVEVPALCRPQVQRSLLMRSLFREERRAYFCRPSRPNSPLSAAMERLELSLADGDLAFA